MNSTILAVGEVNLSLLQGIQYYEFFVAIPSFCPNNLLKRGPSGIQILLLCVVESSKKMLKTGLKTTFFLYFLKSSVKWFLECKPHDAE